MDEPQPLSQASTVKLAAHLARRYSREECGGETPTPSAFFEWCRTHAWMFDREAEAAGAGVDPSAFDLLAECVARPDDSNPLAGLWPVVVLDGRPAPPVPLESVAVWVLLRWADGSVTPVCQAALDSYTAGLGWTDGTASLAVAHAGGELARLFFQQPLAALHRDHSVPLGGAEEWSVFSNFLAQLQRLPQLPPDYRGAVGGYARLAHTMLTPNPPAPEALREAREAARAAVRAASPAAAPDEAEVWASRVAALDADGKIDAMRGLKAAEPTLYARVKEALARMRAAAGPGEGGVG